MRIECVISIFCCISFCANRGK